MMVSRAGMIQEGRNNTMPWRCHKFIRLLLYILIIVLGGPTIVWIVLEWGKGNPDLSRFPKSRDLDDILREHSSPNLSSWKLLLRVSCFTNREGQLKEYYVTTDGTEFQWLYVINWATQGGGGGS
jgi:hypothetical protein